MPLLRRCAFVVVILISCNAVCWADDAEGIKFFEQKIRPVLIEHCYDCHSQTAKKVRGGLLLDSKSGWEKGGDTGGPAIVPGKPAESLLIQSVRYQGDLTMPPKKKLPDAVIADLVAWVKMGAPDPRTGDKTEAKRGDKSWWSLQPVKAVKPPSTPGIPAAWAKNPIDAFVFAKLAEKKLTPSPPADARTLIRRMTYDLTGLPPTPEQVKTFEADFASDADRAVAALADRLLASPQYGEQWGRHWLDVVRFGESNGFERNFIIDDIWPFRDYVIRSINADKPFQQFIREHLAGDVIGKNKPEIEVGSAFLVAGPFDDVGNQDAVASANIRAATLDEIITTTSNAFLGLTVACARCHNHKFDPIPMEDYYRIRAAFEGIKHGDRVIASEQERTAFTQATRSLNEELAKHTAARKKLDDTLNARAKAESEKQKPTRPKVDPQRTEETFPPIEAKFVKFVILAHTGSPKFLSDVPGPVKGQARLTEFEVWTAERVSRNVALASNGGRADGARSATAADFPAAYGPQYTIDGKFGEQWFIGDPAELTITLKQSETIDRITFSTAKGGNAPENGPDKAQGATPCEYEIRTSLDGKTWRTVATSQTRTPWSPAHGSERVRRVVVTPEDARQLAELDRRIADVQKKIAAIPKLPVVWAGQFNDTNVRTFVHKGGDPMKPGDAVVPSSLSVLSDSTKSYNLPATAPEGERRLALAKWITADDNPLTPRVLANRVWHYLFSTGIVDTPSDFGFLGGQPTHPELLDWLTGRLLHHKWKLKPLIREIVLSQTYRQSSTYNEAAAKVDKDARLLWRFPPRRLTGEELRDTMLVDAGKLNRKPGGPGFRLYKVMQNNVSTYTPLEQHGPETYRRAVYHQNVRASVVDLLSDFDFPDVAFSAPRRANTVTPLQSLTMLNHAFTLDMAAALAQRIETESKGDDAARLQRLYALLFQREPTAKERKAGLAFVEKYGWKSFCRAAWNLNELVYLD